MSDPRPAPARPWYDYVISEIALRGWTKTQLSERSGVSRPAIDKWQKNPRPPQAASVNAVADVLDIPRERALRLAGVIAAEPEAHPPPAPDPKLPTPEEMDRLRAHIREVLGGKARAVEDAMDAELGGTPQPRRSSASDEDRWERRPAS